MKIIRENAKARKVISIVLTAVMIVSLLYCVGDMTRRSPIIELDAEAATGLLVDPDTGKYTIPEKKDAAAVGTEENPFVVLEIVPNENMAQFGYLVKGQEPVDMEAINAADQETLKNNESGTTPVLIADSFDAYTTMQLKDSTELVTEFEDVINAPGYTYDRILEDGSSVPMTYVDFAWSPQGLADEYGTYTKVTGDTEGDYHLKETVLETPVIEGYEYVKVDASKLDAAGTAYNTEDPKPITAPDGVTVDADGNTVEFDGTSEVYVKVAEGTGLLSSKKYVKLVQEDGSSAAETEDGGDYSLVYKKVNNDGDTILNGDWEYVEKNKGTFYTPINSNSSTSFKTETGAKYVAFKYVGKDNNKDKQHYAINGTPSNTRIKFSNSNSYYKKYYKLVKKTCTKDDKYDGYDTVNDYAWTGSNPNDDLYTHVSKGVKFDEDDEDLLIDLGLVNSSHQITKNGTGYVSVKSSGFLIWVTYTYTVEKEFWYRTSKREYYYYTYVYDSTGNTNNNGDYYYVFFEPSDEGDYIVDSTSSISKQADYAMAYKENGGYSIGWENVGSNKGHFTKLPNTTTIPQYVGTFTKKDGTTIKLGDYNCVYIGEAPTCAYVNEPGVIGTKDYDKYVLTTKYGTPITTYSYEMEKKTGKTVGEDLYYTWNGMNYSESTALPETDQRNYKKTFEELLNLDAALIKSGEDDETVSFNSVREVGLYKGYEGAKTNADYFKKYGIGLAYKDNDYSKGEDTVAYEFLGWYLEPECVNLYNESTAITGDITLYAKWGAVYSQNNLNDNFKLEFDANLPEGVPAEKLDEVVRNMPGQVDHISAGAKLAAPRKTPALANYVFDGWYSDKECTTSFNFNQTVNMNLTAYAKWTPMPVSVYSFTFAPNTDSTGVYDTEFTVTDMPTEVTNIGKNGYYYSSEDTELNFTSVGITSPECTDLRGGSYLFGGWYLTPDCSVKYEFGTVISDAVTDVSPAHEKKNEAGVIILDEDGNPIYEDEDIDVVLYAKWIPTKDRKGTVTFNANKPKNAVEEVEGIAAVKVQKPYGQKLEGEMPEPTLEGNISAKLEACNVKVITVTPKDFEKEENAELIDRANLIVLNETCSTAMSDIWKSYRNKELFSKKDEDYTSTVKSFANNDLSWDETMRILSRVIGISTADVKDSTGTVIRRKGASVLTCPVIFDYTIYKNALASGSAKDVSFTANYNTAGSKFAYNSATVNYQKGCNLNIYKLYLLTQECNPITLYNAYLKKTTGKHIDSNGKLANNGFTNTTGGDVSDYWTPYTLIPFNILDNEDMTADEQGTLDLIGFNTRVKLSDVDESRIVNRLFVYNATGKNLTESINLPVMSAVGKTDINAVMKSGTTYTAANIIYYMLHSSALYENFSRDLSILEIEPGTGKKNDDYWFWYISRYVPNFTGTVTVDEVATPEFVCRIDDLNSKYDVIYIGTDASNLTNNNFDEYMPKETQTLSAGTYDITGRNTFNKDVKVLSKEKVTNVTYAFKKYTGTLDTGYELCDEITKEPIIKVNSSNKIELSDFGKTIESTYGIEFTLPSVTTTKPTRGSYWSFSVTSGGKKPTTTTYYFSSLTAKKNGLNLEYVFVEKADGIFKDNNSKNGNIYLKPVQSKATVTVTENTTEKNVSANTVINNATVKLSSGATRTTTYLYAHTGNTKTISMTDGNMKSRLGSFNDSSQNDITNVFIYSGNDITFAKFKDLAEFVQAGFPVILSKTVMVNKDGKYVVDSDAIDSSSWMYKFIDELTQTKNGDGSGYKYSWFRENDTSNDEQFVTALKKKTFKLEVLARPVEYKDDSELTTKLNLRDIYVNGDDIDKKELSYTIRINSTDTGRFTLKLFIDANADGKFSETDEGLDALEITDLTTGHTVSYRELAANTSYRVTRAIEEYTGVIPWKLQVVDMEYNSLSGYSSLDSRGWVETQVRDEVTGMSAIRVEEKTQLYVLQIASTGNANKGGSTLDLPTDEERKNSLTGDKGKFQKYADNLKEFEVHFCRVNKAELKEIAKNPDTESVGTVKVYDETTKTKKDKDIYWKDVNMLIVGYADCYNDITDVASLQLIQDFIQAGKTTLFTHDTTSYANFSSEENYKNATSSTGFPNYFWGYNINQYFRDMLGMDRYGVYSNRGKISEITNEVEAATGVTGFNFNNITLGNAQNYNLTYDIAFAPGKKQVLDSDNLAVTYKVIRQNSTNKTLSDVVVMNQGMTNRDVKQYDNDETTSVTKTNNGQIVSYPYNIGDDLTVASTHTQPYQINMESDDIVVWYSLKKDTSSNSHAMEIKNDGVNNYYIFNKGNITYSGVGHSSGLSDNECKLFINTMIAAYTATVTATKPIITNRDKSTVDSDTDYVYVDFDASEKVDPESHLLPSPIGNGVEDATYTKADGTVVNYKTKEVSFTLKNLSIVMNKRMSVFYYPAITVEVDGNRHRVVLYDYPMNLTTYEIYADHNEAITKISDPITYDAPKLVGKITNIDSITAENVTRVESLEEYLVNIPITDSYYRDVLGLPSTYTYEYRLTEGGAIKTNTINLSEYFALDNKSTFEVEIQVAMKYGREEAHNVPLVGTRGVVFMRRGMFTLD